MVLQIYATLISLVYLIFFKPLESPLALGLEIFNECTILNITYMIMCFSGFVSDEWTRSNMGFFYIGVCLANILVHLTVLLLSSAHKIKLIFRRFRCCLAIRNIEIAKKAPLP